MKEKLVLKNCSIYCIYRPIRNNFTFSFRIWASPDQILLRYLLLTIFNYLRTMTRTYLF